MNFSSEITLDIFFEVFSLNETGIPDLASECLYNLGTVGNLHSKMLLSMCERGPLEVMAKDTV